MWTNENIYIYSAIINVLISIILVNKFGLIGVAIGTLIAMFYQTIALSIYNSKYILFINFSAFFKQIIVDIISFFIGIVIINNISFNFNSVANWLFSAVEIFILWLLIILLLNMFFYKSFVLDVFKRIRGRKNENWW